MEQAVKASDHTKRYLIIPSGGSGVRMGADLPKQYIKLGGKTILQHTVEAMLPHTDFIILGVSYDYWVVIEDTIQRMRLADRIQLSVAGKTRFDTVRKALRTVPMARSSASTMRCVLLPLRPWWTNATKRLSVWVLQCLSYSSRRAYATSPTKGQEHNLRKL